MASTQTSNLKISAATHERVTVLAAQMRVTAKDLVDLALTQMDDVLEHIVTPTEYVLGRKERIKAPLRGEKVSIGCNTSKRERIANWGRVLRLGTERLADLAIDNLCQDLKRIYAPNFHNLPVLVHNSIRQCQATPRKAPDETSTDVQPSQQ